MPRQRESGARARGSGRFAARLAAALGFMLLAACGCDSGSDGDPLLVTVFYAPGSGGPGDSAFSDLVLEGVVSAGQAHSLSRAEIEPVDVAEAETRLHDHLAEPAAGTELVITVGFAYADLLDQLGCDFGGRSVLLLDVAGPDCPALRSVTFRTFAPAYLAGAVAVAASTSGRTAVVAGQDIPPVDEFIRGFTQGVTAEGGQLDQVEYLAEDPSGFVMPERAQQVADELFTAGAEVILPVAGGSSVDVIEAAKLEAGRLTFGVDADQTALGPDVVLGSLLKRLDVVVEDGINELHGGVFTGGHRSVGHADGATEFKPNPALETLYGDAVDNSLAAALAAEDADG